MIPSNTTGNLAFICYRVEIFFKLINVHNRKRSFIKEAYMITGKYDRQSDRSDSSDSSKNVRDLALPPHLFPLRATTQKNEICVP
ncbi:hypothetical protein VQ7734_02349 [Vibrio quintilis]|uniref:Uncharacterized protein n=1 Tax=Vibrio quintilis TaxID=1117707 RepID=A0A1M7YV66_9VIBR|nr:hypothetical protein VQ7734_02349 [Vibrio quintilis]